MDIDLTLLVSTDKVGVCDVADTDGKTCSILYYSGVSILAFLINVYNQKNKSKVVTWIVAVIAIFRALLPSRHLTYISGPKDHPDARRYYHASGIFYSATGIKFHCVWLPCMLHRLPFKNIGGRSREDRILHGAGRPDGHTNQMH